MARRRVVEPVTAPGGDPRHIHQTSLEHPLFGHVRIWYRGNQMYRVKWSSPDYGQNVHSLHTNPQKFAEILQKLGIDD